MARSPKYYRFTQPGRQFVIMLLVLAAFSFAMTLLARDLIPIFRASEVINGTIVVVFIIGVLACFWQIWQVRKSVSWINAYAIGNPHKLRGTPRLLKPLAVLVKGDRLPTGISTSSAQSILDSVATRLDETREVTRYIVNLLIFLGLLGTFYGLATTIPGVVDTIRSLNQQSNANAADGFGNIMRGLETQLGGMGAAFGSSLIGLTGSLLVGLLELFAGHAQNRFYREFEEWISSFATVGLVENGQYGGFGDDENSPTVLAFRALNESLVRLDARLAEQNGQSLQNAALFEKLVDGLRTQENMSAEMRNLVRSMEGQLVRMNDEMSLGREASVEDIRRELRSVAGVLERNLQLIGKQG